MLKPRYLWLQGILKFIFISKQDLSIILIEALHFTVVVTPEKPRMSVNSSVEKWKAVQQETQFWVFHTHHLRTIRAYIRMMSGLVYLINNS